MATSKKPAARKTPARKKTAHRDVKTAGNSQEAAALRRTAFIEAYIANGGNGTQAAVKAGFSPATAPQQASRLLRNVQVKQAIAERTENLAKKYELTTDLVVKSLVQELTFDPAVLYDEHGQLRSIKDLPEDARMALTSAEFDQHGSPDAPVYTSKIKWAARHQAREQVMRHLGMFERDNKQRNPLDGLDHDTLKAVVGYLSKAQGKEAEASGRR